ncbi:hypothetical protein VNO78_29131 [Psophocarpus tetragonolobus]|uniref:DYW domain-containing protein n=1 Tax=Psophocarpus tetragonolobus TaxID=3891 RepID=A0AAN9RUK2_PSOTE
MVKFWHVRFCLRVRTLSSHLYYSLTITSVSLLRALLLNSEICEFIVGDKSNDQYKEIYEMVEEMGREIKRAWYVPTTSQVLLDIDEDDKENALYRHSDTCYFFCSSNYTLGIPIRIVNNLRVCEDCHSATKFMSKTYNPEIVVRHHNRFHHFKNGSCSCGDFW